MRLSLRVPEIGLAILETVLAAVVLAAAVGTTVVSAAQLQTSDRADARRLLLEANRLIEGVSENQRMSAVANIASQLARGGNLDDALKVSQSTNKGADQDFAKEFIAWNLVQQGHAAEALALVESLGNSLNKEGQYGRLAAVLADKGDLTGALEIMRTREGPLARVGTLVQIAQQKAREKNKDIAGAANVLKQAKQLAEELIQEDASNATLLADLANTQREIGDTADAFSTLAELSAIAHRYEGAQSQGLLLQLLGCAQAQSGDLLGALQTEEEIARGANADIVLMTIAEEQAKQGLMVDALQSAVRISDQNLRSSALRSVAIVRGEHGTLQDAIEAIERIPDGASRGEAVGVLALEQAEADNPAAALTAQRALEFSRDAGSGSVSSGKGLEMVAVTWCVLGDFTRAVELIKSMPEPDSRVWPLWNLTSMLAEAGKANEALAVADDESAAYPKLYALLGTAQGLLSHALAEETAAAKK